MAELEKTKIELQNAKRRCEFVKSLLADANTEKEFLFQVGALKKCLFLSDPDLCRRSMKSWTECTTMPICQRMRHGLPFARICGKQKNPETHSPRRFRKLNDVLRDKNLSFLF
jgi:hypothetical protein